jgi:hypothetical protein
VAIGGPAARADAEIVVAATCRYAPRSVPLICRHNRFTADCPICSKGTLLDPGLRSGRGSRTSSRSRRDRGTQPAPAAIESRGPFAAAGPNADGHEVRLERVPGGLRLSAWLGGSIVRRAPMVAISDLSALLSDAAGKGLLDVSVPVGATAAEASYGASPGRSGELRDELRVERLDGDLVRIARWILRPNAGWQLQEAPVMLPPARFAQALTAAGERGVLAPAGRAG